MRFPDSLRANILSKLLHRTLGLPAPVKISLNVGVQTLNLQLKVVMATQQVTVQGNVGPTVSTAAASNASATVLRGNDLQSLGDDPEDLQSDLQALAGPSAGPTGGEIYIDGFSGGELPSKDAILEIRVNQNPFSPEYDKLGYGRIEIITKPGAEKFHGTGYYNFGDSFWNSRNPYAAEKAPFLLKEYGASLTGPLNPRTSFLHERRPGRHRQWRHHQWKHAGPFDAGYHRPLHSGIPNPAAPPDPQPSPRPSSECERHSFRALPL